MTNYVDELLEPGFQYYMADIGDYPVLSRAEEHDLMERIRSGDKQAYEWFYSCNLKWVVTISKKYIGRGMPIMDLIQAGNMGLMRAMDKFNHKGGYKFSTYSHAWICQSIGRLLHQKGLVYVPEYIMTKIIRVKRIEQELGINATDEAIAAMTKISVQQLHELRAWSMETVSFEVIVGDEDGDDKALKLESSLTDERQTEEAQRISEQHELRAHVEKALKCLTPRERKVLAMRFGLDDQGGQTLRQAGEELRISRERVRQIEEKALGKLQPLLADVAKRARAVV